MLAGVELDPIKPSEQEWQRLSKWLTGTNHLTPLVPKLPVGVSASPLPDWAAKAWGELSPAQRAARTVTPTDGLAFAGSPEVVASPTLAAVEPQPQL